MRTPIAAGFAGLLLIASHSPVAAHHSHPLFYDQCKSITIEGRVENVLWKNPHVWLDLKTGDGTTYHAEWTSLEGVTRNGGLDAAQGALAAGANVAITGNPVRDPARIRASYPSFKEDPDPKIVDVVQIRRMDDSWSWARPVGGPPPQCGGK
jgi:hypothetical protein